MQGKKKLSAGWIIALIGIPIFIGALDLTVVSAVLPHVIYDLELPIQTQLDKAAWIITGYLMAYSIAMCVMGHLSDLYGRRKVFLIALGIFTLGSLMVAVSDTWLTSAGLRLHYLVSRERVDVPTFSLGIIIASRVVQALGGGAMVPVGMALIGDSYPVGKRSWALGIIAAIDTAGWVVGHLYGGIVVYYFNWHVIFWLNIPVCIAAFALIYWALRGVPQETTAHKIDWVGVALISAFLTLLIVGIGGGGSADVSISANSQDKTVVGWALAASAVCLALTILWERRARHPLFDPALFKIRNLLTAGAANLLIGCGMFIAIANVPIYINAVGTGTLERGAWDSGWLLSALTIPIALAAIPGGWLTQKFGYKLPALAGIAVAGAGFLWMNGWQVETTYEAMIPQLMLTGIGFGLTFSPIASAALDSAPALERGTASAIVLTLRLIGMTVGVSSMTLYDINRANSIIRRLIAANASVGDMVRISQETLVKVIDETFLIAAALCALTFVIILFISNRTVEIGGENDVQQ
jgi:MFS family permease